MDLSPVRKLFPVTAELTYLNNASESPLNTRSRRLLDEYVVKLSTAPHDKPSVRYRTRLALSELLGGRPDEYALVTSTGIGIGIVAAGIDWQPGDNVVIPADEHWNNSYPWFALQRRGVEVRAVPTTCGHRVLPEDLAAAVDGRTRVVTVAAVRFNSGFRADLRAIGELAHRHEALFVVDAAQGAGVVPINVDDDGIDVLACAGFKWMLGMHGTGLLYVREGVQDSIHPVLPGMYAAEDDLRALRYWPDARRYETGTIAYQLYHAWAGGLEILREIGIGNIYARVLELTGRLIAGLSTQPNITLITPAARSEERSAIVVFSVGSADDNKAMYERLRSHGIIITLRGGVLRVSPNFFNTEAEIDEFLTAVCC